jgi:nitrilase
LKNIKSKVASIQMTVGVNLQANLDKAKSLIKIAAKKGVKLLVLPENFAYSGQRKIKTIAIQEESDGPARTFLSEQASENKIWIVGGTIPVINSQASNKNPSSSCFVLDDSGFEVACYKKIHLFDAKLDDCVGSYCESSDYNPGEQPIIVDTPIGSLGLAVCYDLRFPELFRYLSDHGAEIVAVPAAFTSQTGKSHWTSLLRARAIENLMYVIGSNMGDRYHKNHPTWGGSVIIDPWGNIMNELEEGSGIITADIDLGYLESLRNKLPIYDHRRFSVLKP